MKIIKLAIRTLMRFKLYTGINILGLALSLACTVIISRYVYQEFTANHFIKDFDRVYLTAILESDHQYRISGIHKLSNEKNFVDPLHSPIVEKSTSFISITDGYVFNGAQKFNASIFAADSNFLNILTFPLLQGTKDNVLSNPQNAAIAHSFAKKIFGNEDPIGKTLSLSSGQIVTITALIGKPKTKSSICFDLLVSSELQKHWMRMPYTVFRIVPGANIDQLYPKGAAASGIKTPGDEIRYKFFSLKDFYFNRNVSFIDMPDSQGNYTYVLILLAVAALVLTIGIFNFVNIYTVLMLKRAREFGMKKVFGGTAGRIMGQLFAENLVMIGAALVIGLALVEITKGAIDEWMEIPQLSHPAFDVLLSLSFLILLPAITSVYPFIRYNYAPPVVSLKSVSTGGTSIVSRTSFLVIQYIITFSLIVIAVFFVKQLHFMLHTDLGYRTENIVKVQFHEMSSALFLTSEEEQEKLITRTNREMEEIKQRMNESPLFTGWFYGASPNEITQPCLKLKTPDGEFKESAYAYLPGEAFKIYDFKVKEGRAWNDDIDKEQDYYFIVNETAWKLFGFSTLEDAILQPEFRLWSDPGKDWNQNPSYRVIGIIEDFKGDHLSRKVTPLVIRYDKGYGYSKLVASVAKGRKQEAVAFLKKLHDDTVGGEFSYIFLKDEIKEMYREDRKVATIYSVFALIAILISSLGLFGLSLFDVQQRYREIALRKVNGAQIRNIMTLFLKKYVVLLAVAFAFAAPVSYFAIEKYLENFANKASVSWWIFALAAGITLFISLGTLVFHIRKAAGSNPAHILKSE